MLDTFKHCLEQNGDRLTTVSQHAEEVRSTELEDAWQFNNSA